MLDEMLRATVANRRHDVALVCGKSRLTYEELWARINEFTSVLKDAGVAPSDCVAVLLPNCVEFVLAFFAAARLRSRILPLNPHLTKWEAAKAISVCGAKVAITDRRHVELGRSIGGLSQSAVNVILSSDASASMTAVPAAAPHDEDFLVQFSSGSTGFPKRIARTQGNLFRESSHLPEAAGVCASDRILCVIPMFHAHGLGNGLLLAMRTGAQLVLPDPLGWGEEPLDTTFASRCRSVCDLIRKERVTVLPGVPFMFAALVDAADCAAEDLSSVRLCFSAGNFLPQSTFERFRDRYQIEIRQLYGCTEAGSVCLNMAPGVTQTWNSVGTPLGAVEIKIVDEQGAEVSPEVVGEVTFRSPAAAKEYEAAQVATFPSFREGWFFTGDLGWKDQQGFLYLTGRKKLIIDTGGFKVDALEVEAVLCTHRGIAEAVVLGVGTAGGGEMVKAVIVPKAPLNFEEVESYCRDRLAHFKVPTIIEFVNAIPRSPVGKVLRKDLVESKVRFHSLQSIESRVCYEVALLLRVERGVLDFRKTFSDLGMDSVAGVALQRRLEGWLGLPLSPTLVWNYATARALARHLASLVAPLAPSAKSAAADPGLDAVPAQGVAKALEAQTAAILKMIEAKSLLDPASSCVAVSASSPTASVASIKDLIADRTNDLLRKRTE